MRALIRLVPAVPTLIVAAGLAASAVTLDAAQAGDVDAFFKGKQLTLIISSGTGGGYDRYGRTITMHMEKYLPGKPDFIPKNMPGAGGIKAANFLFDVAPKDGSTIGMMDRATATAPLLYGDESKATYNAVKFNWIGSAQREVGAAMIMTASGYKTIADAKTHTIIVGSPGPETDTSLYPRLLNNLAGTKFKIINGYKEQAEIVLAMDRGELDGFFITGLSGPNYEAIKPRIVEGKMIPILQLGIDKNPTLPASLPGILDLVSNEDDKRVLSLVLARADLGRPMAAPPGVPAAIVTAYRDAFRKVMVDPAFLADAEKQGLPIAPIYGEDAQAMVAKLYTTPQAVLDRARSLVASGT
jgi:tripartite-type tricarboxylate transporter receptor subunit TctC